MKKIPKISLIVIVIILIIFLITLVYVLFNKETDSLLKMNSQKDDLLVQLNNKAHELLCAENNKDMASHERAQIGYGDDMYFEYYNKVKKEFTDLQTRYKLKTGLDYPAPQLTSPPTNCPEVK